METFATKKKKKTNKQTNTTKYSFAWNLIKILLQIVGVIKYIYKFFNIIWHKINHKEFENKKKP